MSIPDGMRKLVVRHVRHMETVASHWDGNSGSHRVAIGKLDGDEIVGWISDGGNALVDGPYIRFDRQEETFAALGKAMWHGLGCRHVLFGKEGIAPDPYAYCALPAATQFRGVLRRLEQFRERDIHRSVLFAGPPGTGKSTGIRYLALISDN